MYKWFWKGVVRDIIRIKRLFLHLWQGREFLILPFPSVERHVNYFNKNLNENLISSLGQSETPRADLKMTFLLQSFRFFDEVEGEYDDVSGGWSTSRKVYVVSRFKYAYEVSRHMADEEEDDDVSGGGGWSK